MQLTKTQMDLINKQIARLRASDSYYGKLYRDLGIEKIERQEDFEKLPFSSKDDLRNAYPLGIAAVPEEEIVRIHSQSDYYVYMLGFAPGHPYGARMENPFSFKRRPTPRVKIPAGSILLS